MASPTTSPSLATRRPDSSPWVSSHPIALPSSASQPAAASQPRHIPSSSDSTCAFSTDMVDHPFSGTSRSPTRPSALMTHSSPKPSPPSSSPAPQRPPALPARDALRALIHSVIHVKLHDTRVLVGNLLAIDAQASLLMSSVRELRVLPATPEGQNVARYYPFSRNESAATDGLGAGIGGSGSEAGAGYDGRGEMRERELASVLVPMRHVEAVYLSAEDARAWGGFAGVQFGPEGAVPPAKAAAGAA